MSKPLALVVEDQMDISNVFAQAMRSAGFETELIYSGDKALDWLNSHAPDIVILDLRLPYVSGTDILRHIRADARLAETLVIVATAYPGLATFLQEQADMVLIKPVSFVQLRDLARRMYFPDE